MHFILYKDFIFENRVADKPYSGIVFNLICNHQKGRLLKTTQYNYIKQYLWNEKEKSMDNRRKNYPNTRSWCTKVKRLELIVNCENVV